MIAIPDQLTKEEALELIMRLQNCSMKEACVFYEKFKQNQPEAVITIGLPRT